jgi:hypothetical protein
VTYPGYVPGQQLQYWWKTPPYINDWTPNPDTGYTPGPATAGGLSDDQLHKGFLQPYATDAFTADQVFQFQCTYYKNNQWVTLLPQSGTIAIRRVVSVNGTTWQYTVTKSGASNSGVLP